MRRVEEVQGVGDAGQGDRVVRPRLVVELAHGRRRSDLPLLLAPELHIMFDGVRARFLHVGIVQHIIYRREPGREGAQIGKRPVAEPCINRRAIGEAMIAHAEIIVDRDPHSLLSALRAFVP